MLHAIAAVNWDADEKKRIVVLVDDGYAEWLKWSGDNSFKISSSIAYYKLSDDALTLSKIRLCQPDRLLIMTSIPFPRCRKCLELVVKCCEKTDSIILTTAPDNIDHAHHEFSYAFLENYFLPSIVRVKYFPFHTIQLLPQFQNLKVFFPISHILSSVSSLIIILSY
jgi:hypothetical protein